MLGTHGPVGARLSRLSVVLTVALESSWAKLRTVAMPPAQKGIRINLGRRFYGILNLLQQNSVLLG